MNENQKTRILERLKNIPNEPGCYLWVGQSNIGAESEAKGSERRILYVGKAIKLRNRIRQYLNSEDYKTRYLMLFAEDVEFMVTGNEVEALLLENNLIKKHNPPYNVRLKDDKRYPYLCLTFSEPFPRLVITRRKTSTKNIYFGPFSDVSAARNTMALIHKVFPIRKRALKLPLKNPARPCLNYHIGRCWAPCTGKVEQQDYRQMVLQIKDFLEGKSSDVRHNLQKQMQGHSEAMEYEQAGRLKSVIADLDEVVNNKQVVHEDNPDSNFDVAGIYVCSRESFYDEMQQEGNYLPVIEDGYYFGQIILLQVRNGNLVSKQSFALSETRNPLAEDTDLSPEAALENDYLESFFREHYLGHIDLPSSIYISADIKNRQAWQKTLNGPGGNQTVISYLPASKADPPGGLMRMAMENARLSLRERILSEALRSKRLGLKQIQGFLSLKRPPKDIECYDISNIQGKEAVASGVHFRDGSAYKAGYRKYRIKMENEPNDPAMMNEVIGRRLKLLSEKKGYRPDLLVVDGGITQLRAALEARRRFNLSIPIIGLAKKEEELYLETGEILNLDNNNPGMQILISARDEAHRFAVSYHRNLRMKRNLKSILDEVEGIGEKRRSQLMTELRKINIADFSQETLEEYLHKSVSIPGKVARNVASRLLRVN